MGLLGGRGSRVSLMGHGIPGWGQIDQLDQMGRGCSKSLVTGELSDKIGGCI